MRLNSKQIAQYTSAEVLVEAIDPSKLATSITWDSREVKQDSVYVAFPGERVDGHSFVEESLRKGAIIALVMHDPGESARLLAKEMGAAILMVASTFTAFTDLASAWRNHLRGKVIALTGSTGKTTTKNLVRDVLSTTFTTTATHANQNNELGVPKTLLDANPETEFVVVEMGMRGLGQLRSLCEFVKPNISLITNVGECHIELLGSKEAIAQAKSEVIEALAPGQGKAIINAADEFSPYMLKHTSAEERSISICYYDGTGQSCQSALAYATDISLNQEGCPSFTLHVNGEEMSCTMSLRGIHNVHNACAAAALGYTCGVSLENIVKGLASSLPEVGRQEVLKNRAGVTVINDAYNANPDSMKASLSMFISMEVAGKRYAVLGDMGELGSFAQGCHEGIGQFIASLGAIDYLICTGQLSKFIASAAIEAGYPESSVFVTESRGEALAQLEIMLKQGDAVLVKASHSMELDRIVKGLLN